MAFFKKNKKTDDEAQSLLNTMEKEYRKKIKTKDEKDKRIRERDIAYEARKRSEENRLHSFKVEDNYLDNVRKKK